MAIPSEAERFFESLNLQRSRTPSELEALTDQVRQGFESAEVRRSSRPGGPLTKKYFEGVYPLTLLTRHLYRGRDDVSCEPNFDDRKSFDAMVVIGPASDFKRVFIEFTYARDGQDQALRMENLNRDGRVSLTGPVAVEGTKRTGRKVKVSDETVPRERRLETDLELILDRLERKSGSKYEGVDFLVLVFDDYLGFRKPEELQRLRAEIKSSSVLARLNFKALVLLGASGETFLKFPLPSVSAEMC